MGLKFLQPEKAEGPIISTCPRFKSVKLVQFWKALVPIFLTPEGIMTSWRLLQPLKAQLGISVIVVLRWILLSDVHPLHRSPPISLTEEGNEM